MTGKHPKRRKDKYNPYSVYEQDGHYYISFKDGEGVRQKFAISKKIYEEFDSFELADLSHLNEWDRHIEQSEIWEVTLNDRAVERAESVEDIVLKNIQIENLYSAIRQLPEMQRRRLERSIRGMCGNYIMYQQRNVKLWQGW